MCKFAIYHVVQACCIMHMQICNILQALRLEVTCLNVEFGRTENLLDVLTQYEIFGFCRLGFNWRKFYRTGTLNILIDDSPSPVKIRHT